MFRFVLPGVLIVLSVISRCDGAPGQPDPLDRTALGLLAKIRNPYEVQRQRGERNAGLCRLCERMVTQLMALARKTIEKEINVICTKMKNFKNNCIQGAKQVEGKVIRVLFHGGNAKESCKRMQMC